jgi:orotate phosphoribosyltransferase
VHYRSPDIVGKTTKRIVLFDDVVTSGSQIFGSLRKLRDAGLEVVATYEIVDVLESAKRGDPAGWKKKTLPDPWAGIFL